MIHDHDGLGEHAHDPAHPHTHETWSHPGRFGGRLSPPPPA
jgi:hypothetical protein